MEEPKFPLTASWFISCQEAVIKRKLSMNEKDASEAWLPIINSAYIDGCRNDTGAIISTLEGMDDLISQQTENEILQHFLKSCRRWILYAWKRGSDAKR